MLKIVVFVVISVLACVDCAKILAVVSTPAASHQIVYRRFTQELARRGHDITIITTHPAFPKGKTPVNLTEIDVSDTISIWFQHDAKVEKGSKSTTPYSLMETVYKLITEVTEAHLRNVEVQKMIQDGREFDLIFIEGWTRVPLAFTHAFKAPAIILSTAGGVTSNFEIVGAMTHPILYPLNLIQSMYDLTFWDRLKTIYEYYSIKYLQDSMEDIENDMIRSVLGPDTPSLTELSANVEMIFLNVFPIWDQNRPVPPSVVYLGALHLTPEKSLPKDLQAYLDSSTNGVVYMSFGTNMNPSVLPKHKIDMFIKVFSELPYNILWKWNDDVLPGKSDNIKISKWLPQQDLLRHPKVKTFITQGGLHSIDEAMYAGVPIIGVPMGGDQWYNVDKCVQYKTGVRLDFETITENKIREAIERVTQDDSYRQNIEKLRTILYDTPQSPLERAVWWTEHVLRHGGASHLRSPAANISWSEYLQLDIIIFLFTLVLVILTSILIGTYVLIKMVNKKQRPKQKSKKQKRN